MTEGGSCWEPHPASRIWNWPKRCPVIPGGKSLSLPGRAQLDTQISRWHRGRTGGWRSLGTVKSSEDARGDQFPQDSAVPSGSVRPDRMLGLALAMGVLLALLGCTATEHCGEWERVETRESPWMGRGIPVTFPLLPAAPQDLVCRLLQSMEGSIKPGEVPNPSILLAMSLLGVDTQSPNYKLLLQEIKEEVVTRAQKGREGNEGGPLVPGDQIP
ncbi:PREDICTED: uncharacterized protein LOC108509471 [Lepidothrix coronata]|uniref:Uncharacterized protein LOC108509471 n=1 Tax=Lepidothrix coronata TaxID=321398 RepID=A0A6J0J8K0_9PASS|nr:PREDICTED: uncharacterized protein LOC108509471 [Lepidothrix coronata]